MRSRERVIAALNYQTVDRVPRDLSGMRATGDIAPEKVIALYRAAGKVEQS